jgi:hypothetical protein
MGVEQIVTKRDEAGYHSRYIEPGQRRVEEGVIIKGQVRTVTVHCFPSDGAAELSWRTSTRTERVRFTGPGPRHTVYRDGKRASIGWEHIPTGES